MQIKSISIYILFACFFFSCSSGLNLTNNSQSPQVENVRFNQEDNMVTIYYDLIANSGNSGFHVQLLMELENGEVFELNSASVSGDIGSNVQPGTEKKINWNVLEDYPRGLETEQIQFAINVRNQSRHVNRGWIYAATGALVLGAGITAGILFLGEGGETSGLPLPPSRPGS